MKKRNKVLALAMAGALLVSGSIFGTYAYLSSTDKVENTFTVGKVAITLDETKMKDGTPVEGERTKANEYKMVPSKVMKKDPTVHVDAASEESYLFWKLEIKGYTEYKAACEKHQMTADYTPFIQGLDADLWTVEDKGNGVYLFTKKTTVNGTTGDVTLFTDFKTPEKFDNADLASLDGKFKLDITAYAVQKEGFNTAADALAALNLQ